MPEVIQVCPFFHLIQIPRGQGRESLVAWWASDWGQEDAVGYCHNISPGGKGGNKHPFFSSFFFSPFSFLFPAVPWCEPEPGEAGRRSGPAARRGPVGCRRGGQGAGPGGGGRKRKVTHHKTRCHT